MEHDGTMANQMASGTPWDVTGDHWNGMLKWWIFVAMVTRGDSGQHLVF
jgi:hypothetical protein